MEVNHTIGHWGQALEGDCGTPALTHSCVLTHLAVIHCVPELVCGLLLPQPTLGHQLTKGSGGFSQWSSDPIASGPAGKFPIMARGSYFTGLTLHGAALTLQGALTSWGSPSWWCSHFTVLTLHGAHTTQSSAHYTELRLHGAHTSWGSHFPSVPQMPPGCSPWLFLSKGDCCWLFSL